MSRLTQDQHQLAAVMEALDGFGRASGLSPCSDTSFMLVINLYDL
jgi:hypothetical protein